MSDVITNASRYNTTNTFRSDTAGKTRGNSRNSSGASIGFDCSGLVYHVLRESGYNVPYATSGAMVDGKTFSGNWATVVSPETSLIKPGTLVYFSGHVGLVQSYNPETKTGAFLSMTGSHNVGLIKPEEPFTTDPKNTAIYWGGTTAFKGFAEVKQELYDRTLDQHANGANANTPIFNIPEASNSGFTTLPNNGGFPAGKGATDLSSRADIAAASNGVTRPSPIDLPNANTAFATTLAALESDGQPNNGYGSWAQDGHGIGAIGRYGFRASSLKAIGWMDDSGNWTDKARASGVSSPEDFRDNPDAQEIARVAYMGKIKSELQANGSWGMIGQTVEGHVVTEAGLIAAAWKEGAGAVYKFFSGDSTNANADTNIMFRFDRFARSSLPGETAARDGFDTSGAHLLTQQAGGHWEDTNQYDANGNVTMPGERVWVPSVAAASNGSSMLLLPSNHVTDGAIYLSRDGASATLPNGQVINAGEGGLLQINAQGQLIFTRPAAGYESDEGIYNVTTYSRSGLPISNSQVQLVYDSSYPGDASMATKVDPRFETAV